MYILIAYFLDNICAKNCRNRIVSVSCKGGTFVETRCRWCWIIKRDTNSAYAVATLGVFYDRSAGCTTIVKYA